MDNEKYISNSYGTRQLTFLLENNRAQLDWAYEYLKKKDPYIIQQKTMKDLKKFLLIAVFTGNSISKHSREWSLTWRKLGRQM